MSEMAFEIAGAEGGFAEDNRAFQSSGGIEATAGGTGWVGTSGASRIRRWCWERYVWKSMRAADPEHAGASGLKMSRPVSLHSR